MSKQGNTGKYDNEEGYQNFLIELTALTPTELLYCLAEGLAGRYIDIHDHLTVDVVDRAGEALDEFIQEVIRVR